MSEFVKKFIRPLLEDEFNRGYIAGVTAEKLVKDKEFNEREYAALKRGEAIGETKARAEFIREMEREIEEISAEEFAELAGIKEETEPFGFVGTIDDLSLVLEEATE